MSLSFDTFWRLGTALLAGGLVIESGRQERAVPDFVLVFMCFVFAVVSADVWSTPLTFGLRVALILLGMVYRGYWLRVHAQRVAAAHDGYNA